MMEYKILATKNGQAFYHVIYNWQDAESTIEEFLRSGCNVEEIGRASCRERV